MQAFFGVISTFVQTNLDSVIPVDGNRWKGKHYNRVCLIRESFSRLIFWLFIERSIYEKNKWRLFYDSLPGVHNTDVNLIKDLVLPGLNGEFEVAPQ